MRETIRQAKEKTHMDGLLKTTNAHITNGNVKQKTEAMDRGNGRGGKKLKYYIAFQRSYRSSSRTIDCCFGLRFSVFNHLIVEMLLFYNKLWIFLKFVPKHIVYICCRRHCVVFTSIKYLHCSCKYDLFYVWFMNVTA